MKSKEYIYSVKNRKSVTDKRSTVFEVMVLMPHYKDYPVSVGGKAYIFDTEIEALDHCRKCVAGKQEHGFIASVATS